jgi:hypothetical protein
MITINTKKAMAILMPEGKAKMLKLKDLPEVSLACGYTLKSAIKLAISKARENKVVLHNISSALGYFQQLVWHVKSFDNKDGQKALDVIKKAIQEHGEVVTHEYHVKYNRKNDGTPIWDLVQGEAAKEAKLKELRGFGYNPVVDHSATMPVFNI